MDKQELEDLVNHLVNQPESELIEFKENCIEPKKLGELISALSNSATLLDKDCGYIVFGVCDKVPRRIVGTSYKPKKEKLGNQEIESWIQQCLYPRINFSIYEYSYNNDNVVVFCIPPSTERPVAFTNIEYIRVGSNTWKLREQPGKERDLWAKTQFTNFEHTIAKSNLSVSEVLDFLEYQKYFSLLKIQSPSETEKFVDQMAQHNLLKKGVGGKYDITNLGAILFAKDVTKFSSIQGKSVRVIVYKGNDNLYATKENEFSSGYAATFEDLVKHINGQLPSSEEISGTLREERKAYPDIAIREILANALIHQDLSLSTGIGPMVEIFKDRIEITNSGEPLIEINRFIDHAPTTRNKGLAGFMRNAGFCEERGSGIDRALTEIVLHQLPAPKFEKQTGITKVTLFAHKDLKDMTMDDKVRACFQHCVLMHVKNKKMTNASLRERLKIKDSNHPAATAIINETMKQNLIKKDERRGKYVPIWV